MTKQELLELWQKDLELAAKGLTYLLHIGTSQINQHTRDDYSAVLDMAGYPANDKAERMAVFDFAKALASLPAEDLLDCLAMAAGWASIEDILPERPLQLKPDFSDTARAKELIRDNLTGPKPE